MNNTVRLRIMDNLDDFRRDMTRLPDLTPRQARAVVAQLRKVGHEADLVAKRKAGQ